MLNAWISNVANIKVAVIAAPWGAKSLNLCKKSKNSGKEINSPNKLY